MKPIDITLLFYQGNVSLCWRWCVANLQAQKRIFDVGDSKQAVTITANGHALQSAAAQGVQIEAFVHKAMWLTGV